MGIEQLREQIEALQLQFSIARHESDRYETQAAIEKLQKQAQEMSQK